MTEKDQARALVLFDTEWENIRAAYQSLEDATKEQATEAAASPAFQAGQCWPQ
jgi:hypothetical protein